MIRWFQNLLLPLYLDEKKTADEKIFVKLQNQILIFNAGWPANHHILGPIKQVLEELQLNENLLIPEIFLSRINSFPEIWI